MRRARRPLAISVLPALLLSGVACTEEPPPEMPPVCPIPPPGIVPRDGLVVRDRQTLRPGTYHLEDAGGDGLIRLEGPGASLVMTGVTIVGHAPGDERAPDTFAGYGVVIADAPSARLTGGALRGFKVAVAVRDAPGAIVEDLDVSGNFRQRLHSTLEAEDLRDWLRPHDNDANEWETRYGAGISVTDSRDVTVRRCRARNGQNGLLLTRSNGAHAYDNDFSLLSGWGIALYRTSGAIVCRNRLDRCVRGYSHGVYDRGQDSAGILVFEQCSGNVFALNSATHGGDGFFLYAGEDTVQRTGEGGSNGNVVYQNDFSHAVANAIEATFSVGNVFAENVLSDSRHGVWAGYSSETRILGNAIADCDHGISIEHGVDNKIEGNRITGCGNGVHLWWDADPELAETAFGRARDIRSRENRIGPWNHFEGNMRSVWLQDDRSSRIVGNAFDGDAPRLVLLLGNCTGLLFEGNEASGGRLLIEARHEGRVRFAGTSGGLETPSIVGPGRVDVEREDLRGALHFGHAPDDEPLVDVIALPGAQDPTAQRDGPRGRDTIRIDEWGPVEPRDARIVQAPWDVRWFRWKTDPREDADAFAALIAGEPLRRETIRDLDFAWGAGAPHADVPADGFATTASTTVTLPGGAYRLVTVSDDGIRVRLDGSVITEDWTHHAPTMHTATLELTAGTHTIEVEHFELDGRATLSVHVERE